MCVFMSKRNDDNEEMMVKFAKMLHSKQFDTDIIIVGHLVDSV